MSKKVLVALADGCEEMEAVCVIDVLRRAGAASRGVRLVADRLVSACADETFDLIVLPGGLPGAEHLRDSAELVAMLKRQQQQGRLYAAICASPAVVLQHHGLLAGRRATCYPGFDSQLENPAPPDERVVVDENCVTSSGPGTALEFALKLVELLYEPAKAQEVAQQMVADVGGVHKISG
jgi:4-methyl-5(b-hydroxyethyl)-thiazole monophosphate biosynthesis